MLETHLVPQKRANSKGENLASLLNSLQKAHDEETVNFLMWWIAFSDMKPRKTKQRKTYMSDLPPMNINVLDTDSENFAESWEMFSIGAVREDDVNDF